MEDLNSWQDKFKECCYAKQLLDKITYLNSVSETAVVNVEEVKKAVFYAKKYHGSQKRQSGEPFYVHPLEVAYIVMDYVFTTDTIVTSILHDTIEDTVLTQEMITMLFSKSISDQVMSLTRLGQDNTKISSAKMLELLYTEKKYCLLIVKLVDRLHNMRTIYVKSPRKVKETANETLIHFYPFAQHFGMQALATELYMLCKQVIPNNYST